MTWLVVVGIAWMAIVMFTLMVVRAASAGDDLMDEELAAARAPVAPAPVVPTLAPRSKDPVAGTRVHRRARVLAR